MLKTYQLEASVFDKQDTKPKHVKSLTLSDIKRLPKFEMDATMQCAGNRRKEMSQVKEVKGLSWNCGSISTAKWTGARLTDILKAMGFKDEDFNKKYIQFEGLDVDPTGTPYGSSIAMEKALDPNQCIMVAYEMNGEPVPADHGFPLRLIIPGVVGARNVKWLKKIVLSDEESHSHWQRKDYKCFNPSVDFNTCDFDTAYAVQETPVQSVISEPSASSSISADDGYVTVRGYAFSGGGRGIARVDLSLDGGETWLNAELDNNGQSPYKSWRGHSGGHSTHP
ncbi:SUOX [Bugula neritina]|uniref:SUOX n=1 Tax=Bugula neritina TaxID=10212 RepID=A0A7J7K043_BUGNE|nr:SUOX [Bugula neritina]